MRFQALAIATALLTTVPASAGLFDGNDCDHSAPRRVMTSPNGITKVIIHAAAGSLEVNGVANAAQIVASGTACTSDDDFLERMTLTMRRSGSELHIDANVPQKTIVFGFFNARLDFAVTLPQGMPVDIDDDSGWMKVANTGATTIDDDSGSIEVRNVRGAVVIHDDSGSIDVDNVIGNLTIEDDSGDIQIKNVTGNVEIEDDSGSMTIARVEGSLRVRNDDSGSITVQNVRHDVLVDDDSSGSIDVTDIGGNFTVRHKSGGHIEYARVSGKVSIPERD
jgi:hypothetical protein